MSRQWAIYVEPSELQKRSRIKKDEWAEIAKLGLPDEARPYIEYVIWLYKERRPDPLAQKRIRQRNEARDIQKALRNTLRRIEDFNERFIPSRERPLERAVPWMSQLRSMIDWFGDQSKGRRGQKGDRALHSLVRNLDLTLEYWKGQVITRAKKRGKDLPIKYIETACRIANPKLTLNTIENSMKYVIRTSRAFAASAGIPPSTRGGKKSPAIRP
jgi:hypothetical protein